MEDLFKTLGDILRPVDPMTQDDLNQIILKKSEEYKSEAAVEYNRNV